MPEIHRIVGYQNWRHLLFLHWRVPPQCIQTLLPAGLTVEIFDDSAWLAVVPFSMQRIRPWWSPPVPGISWFLETNVRTYVRHANGQSGVWFFSLDANQRLAVVLARRFWHLNYRRSALQLSVRNGKFKAIGTRHDATAEYAIRAEIDLTTDLAVAAEDSLEDFLLERYHLFAQRPDGQFVLGQVHHSPYEFRPVTSVQVTETLTAAAGCPVSGQPDHIVFSPGVDVKVSALSAYR